MCNCTHFHRVRKSLSKYFTSNMSIQYTNSRRLALVFVLVMPVETFFASNCNYRTFLYTFGRDETNWQWERKKVRRKLLFERVSINIFHCHRNSGWQNKKKIASEKQFSFSLTPPSHLDVLDELLWGNSIYKFALLSLLQFDPTSEIIFSLSVCLLHALVLYQMRDLCTLWWVCDKGCEF